VGAAAGPIKVTTSSISVGPRPDRKLVKIPTLSVPKCSRVFSVQLCCVVWGIGRSSRRSRIPSSFSGRSGTQVDFQ
jgi:hypothetical protein